MGKFTITIAEENGALSISVEGSGKREGVAAATTEALMRLAKDIVPKAAKRAALMGNCNCEQCQAARAAGQAEGASGDEKPTIH